ncbi:myb/SANT-like DNA-binding domain-containing protein 3 [Colias croceus]|uniref:myb/SANT-like DNA-binding domain-containing protein 3 n=1 Tax=Colias crocea TaxID=72248 RepID=UPI001E27A10E|nr:myb/SANT-like DNA-binding domain-containing protein 3 [Colias croceus]
MDPDCARMEKKKPPHTEYEKQLLIELVQPLITTLDCRKTDGVTVKKKHEAWEKLTVEFNSSRNITHPVTSKQLKKMWQNLKAKARDAKTIANQSKKTGGGPQPPEIGALETQVLAVMPNVMPTIAVDIDSDMMYVEDHESEADDDSSAWLPIKNRVTELEVIPAQSSQDNVKLPSASSQETDSTLATQHIRGSSKRKGHNEEAETLDDVRKKIYKRELQHMEERFELEKKLLLEKHSKEIEILEIKKLIALKELNK